MGFLIGGIVTAIILTISIIREPRSFYNALLLMSAAVLLFLGFADMTNHMEYIQQVIIAIVFFFVPITVVFIAILLIINGFVMIKKEGKSLKNLLSFFVGVCIIIGIIVSIGIMLVETTNTYIMVFLWLGAILSAYFAFTFVALLLYSSLYTHIPKQKKCDYIIVHGCGLLGGDRVSPLLKGRVDKAVEFYEEIGGSAKLVLSGGQGSDEKISEAKAMENYLIEKGFPLDRIILEDKSTTTYENLRNVRDMLDSDNKKSRYFFVTNDYHVFRTGLFAKKLKMNAVGIGSKTAAYYWPSAFIREYVAVMMKFKWITVVVFLIWLAGAISSLMPF